MTGQMICAGILFCVILFGSGISSKWSETAKQVFETDGEKTAAWDYAQGKPLREILVDQCRQILIEAGYHGQDHR